MNLYSHYSPAISPSISLEDRFDSFMTSGITRLQNCRAEFDQPRCNPSDR